MKKSVSQTYNKRIFAWFFLLLAIALEVSALALLKVIPLWLESIGTNGIVTLFGLEISTTMIAKVNLLFMIAISYYCMSLALRKIALGVAYSTWEIVGLIGVLLISFVFFDPSLSVQQYIGIGVGFVGIICVILGEEH
ncbi:SMR drug efflux transporter [Helicobacter didelphidarum]|uniref:Spermidine export protein MdtJ n=1 Tax=Helicobacter didelphidarum TaxID=2040648 RepID=A0A3D8IHH5_9HELI|nr:SMR family transporter [Helicobacter didelphidarum]RDU64031.1 SMR drug efflux transporter [Helicobacter didelphidarum]